MVFSKRMEALADLCQGARRVIDVGCDHAQLCALLVTEYGVEHAFASDIRPGPLENARRTIAELGLKTGSPRCSPTAWMPSAPGTATR